MSQPPLEQFVGLSSISENATVPLMKLATSCESALLKMKSSGWPAFSEAAVACGTTKS